MPQHSIDGHLSHVMNEWIIVIYDWNTCGTVCMWHCTCTVTLRATRHVRSWVEAVYIQCPPYALYTHTDKLCRHDITDRTRLIGSPDVIKTRFRQLADVEKMTGPALVAFCLALYTMTSRAWYVTWWRYRCGLRAGICGMKIRCTFIRNCHGRVKSVMMELNEQ